MTPIPRLTAALLALVTAATVPLRASAATTAVQRLAAPDRMTVIDLVPKSGPGIGGPAAPAAIAPRATPATPGAFTWVLQAQNGAVYTDLSMADPTRGFASAELGQVYRTTDGATWQLVLNLGFPRYWYGVHALTPDSVFITGFQNPDLLT